MICIKPKFTGVAETPEPAVDATDEKQIELIGEIGLAVGTHVFRL